MADNKETIAGYIPVINDGYLRFFEKHPQAEIGVFDESITSQFDYLRKDIRALSPESAALMLRGIGRRTRLIGERALGTLMMTAGTFLPDDDVSRELLSRYPGSSATLEPVFLRWHRENTTVNKEIVPDREITMGSKDPVLQALQFEMKKSTNWWRRVGAAVVQGETIVRSTHNSSVPTAYSSAIDGDPRITAKRGESIETSIDIHAEARLIAEMAREGISTQDTSIVVSTFPCPNCAKLIAESGITSCYYLEGYAMLDGVDVMRTANIELVKINTDLPALNPHETRPYPTSQS